MPSPDQQLVTAQEFLAQQLPSKQFAGLATAVIDVSLQWASRIVLGYVRKRKVLPLLGWGDDLKHETCRIAAYDIVSKRGYAPGSGSNSEIRERYLDAMRWLVDVSRGLVELVDCVDSSTTPDVDQATPLVSSDPIVNWSYQTRFPRRGDPTNGLG